MLVLIMGNEQATKARENGADATETRPLTVPASAALRARPTTDPTLFLGDVDGRSREARRYRDVVAELVQQLGGTEMASAAEVHLVRRAAALIVHAELLETRMANGAPLALDEHTKLANTLRRLLLSLGLRPRPRPVETLDELVQRKYGTDDG